MERKEFLSLVGLGSASVFAAACLAGCSKDSGGNWGSYKQRINAI